MDIRVISGKRGKEKRFKFNVLVMLKFGLILVEIQTSKLVILLAG